jgi:hypothetical protein
MAFTESITMGGGANGQPRWWHIVISETSVGAASEWDVSPPNFPRAGMIVNFKAVLTAGSGTTIQPSLGRAAAYTAATTDPDFISEQSAAAASIADQSAVRFDGGSGSLYGRSAVDAGADNSITTEILVVADF